MTWRIVAERSRLHWRFGEAARLVRREGNGRLSQTAVMQAQHAWRLKYRHDGGNGGFMIPADRFRHGLP